MAICWERAVPWLFTCVVFIFDAVLVVRVPFPFGVWDRMWDLIVSVPDHCRLSTFKLVCHTFVLFYLTRVMKYEKIK